MSRSRVLGNLCGAIPFPGGQGWTLELHEDGERDDHARAIDLG